MFQRLVNTECIRTIHRPADFTTGKHARNSPGSNRDESSGSAAYLGTDDTAGHATENLANDFPVAMAVPQIQWRGRQTILGIILMIIAMTMCRRPRRRSACMSRRPVTLVFLLVTTGTRFPLIFAIAGFPLIFLAMRTGFILFLVTVVRPRPCPDSSL